MYKRQAWAALDQASLRPGAPMPVCTFDFLFVDPVNGTYFVGIAGHCTEGEGERVELVGQGEIGTVVFDSDNRTTDGIEERVDFALIQLDEGMNAIAHPQMLNHGGPTGIARCEDVEVGETIEFHGQGMVFGELAATRDRTGVLVGCDGRDYMAMTNALWGDSGSAVLHGPSQKAMGIVSRLGVFASPPSELTGPTLPYILTELAKGGFANVRLATVDGGYVGLDG